MSDQFNVDRELSDEHLDGVEAGIALVVEMIPPGAAAAMVEVQAILAAWVAKQREYNEARCTA